MLGRLRDMAAQREAELTEMLEIRDQDLGRLKDIEGSHGYHLSQILNLFCSLAY